MKSLWTAVAATLLTVSIATAADVTPPDVLAKNTANTLLEELKANQEQFKQNPDQLYEVVDRIVLPHFDFDYVSKLVLARYWRKATPEQRTRFQQAFRSQLVGFYGDALLDYSNEKCGAETDRHHRPTGSDRRLWRRCRRAGRGHRRDHQIGDRAVG